MPDFIKYLRRESRFFLFVGSLLALVVGLVTWPVFLYALDAYDSFVPIREEEAFGMVLGISVLVTTMSGESLLPFLVVRCQLTITFHDRWRDGRGPLHIMVGAKVVCIPLSSKGPFLGTQISPFF